MAVEGNRSAAIVKLLPLRSEVFKVLELGYVGTLSSLLGGAPTVFIDGDHG